MMRQMQGGSTSWLKSGKRRRRISDLDELLIKSERRGAEPRDKLFVRMTLTGNQTVEGQIIWADMHFIKYQSAKSGAEVIVPKGSVVTLEMLS